MPRPRNLIPLPRKHSSGQSRVTIDGKDYLLGPWGTPQAEQSYRRIIAQWLAKEGQFAPKDEPVTVDEVFAGYWLYAEKYYGYDLDPKRGDCCNLKSTMAIVRGIYGDTKAADFGPLDLRAVQGEMIRRKWCRNLVNQQTGRIKQIFRWATGEELIPPSVWHALLACPGLKRGKTDAYETKPVKPVPIEHVNAIKDAVRPRVWAIIQFMLTTGCRPNEACQIRPCDLDKSNPKCWVYRPAKHKTEHHGHDRLILVGPKAQKILKPHLKGKEPEEWLFIAKADKPYKTSTLRRAIDRACRSLEIPVWGPNRLRHTRATELRPHGLDVVATVLGHSKIETTQIYSEKNLAAAMELVERVG